MQPSPGTQKKAYSYHHRQKIEPPGTEDICQAGIDEKIAEKRAEMLPVKLRRLTLGYYGA
jgi:hypothetical protein